MAWMDWNRMCSVCGEWNDARHGESLTTLAVTCEGEYAVCDSCLPQIQKAHNRAVAKLMEIRDSRKL